MNIPLRKPLYLSGISIVIGVLSLLTNAVTASFTSRMFPEISDEPFQTIAFQNENPIGHLDNLQMLVTPGPGEVQVYGEIKYDAEQQNDGPPQPIYNQPLGRVIMKLYDRQSGGDVLVATTRADDTGNYEFPPIPNWSGIDLYLEIYATDDDGSADARVKVVDEDEAVWYHPQPGYPSVDVGQNLPDGPFLFNYTIPIDSANQFSQPFYIFDLTADRAFNWVDTETSWGNQRLLTIHWPDFCVVIVGDACFRADFPSWTQGEGEIYLGVC